MTDFIEIETYDYEREIKEKKKGKKSTPYMTKFEYTKLVAARALQLQMGATPTVETDGCYDSITIAMKEVEARTVPLVILRTLNDGTKELWNVKEMHIRDH